MADGWIAHELGSPHHLETKILPILEEGLTRGQRRREDITVVASACCAVHPDSHEAKRRVAGLVAFYASVRTYTSFFAEYGFESEAVQIQDRFRDGDIEGMLSACPDAMVDAFAIAGTPDEVRVKVAAYEGVADVVKLTPPRHYVTPEVTREAQESILEYFSE
jgi:alkanesulfonate monooxygenase SsuD/methylene tetrahydromethanopterin reductase-like flavin-dependent oxidoreductase (luciferase family)